MSSLEDIDLSNLKVKELLMFGTRCSGKQLFPSRKIINKLNLIEPASNSRA